MHGGVGNAGDAGGECGQLGGLDDNVDAVGGLDGVRPRLELQAVDNSAQLGRLLGAVVQLDAEHLHAVVRDGLRRLRGQGDGVHRRGGCKQEQQQQQQDRLAQD